MMIPRSRIVNLQTTRWYHCISRCVKRSFLLSDELFDRKTWIEKRLQIIESIVAISVGGFSTIDRDLQYLDEVKEEHG